jgi:hypothetical protein
VRSEDEDEYDLGEMERDIFGLPPMAAVMGNLMPGKERVMKNYLKRKNS